MTLIEFVQHAAGPGAVAVLLWYGLKRRDARLDGHAEALRSIREKYVRRDDFKDTLDRIEGRLQCLDGIKLDIGELKGLLKKKS